jgi:hypothetical protein
MKVRIEAIQTVKGSALLHADVAFLDDKGQVVHRNDFIMQIAPTYRVYVGEIGPAGEILDPEAYETHETDVPAEILTNIRAYLARHPDLGKLPADYRDPHIQREDTDPLGLRARPGVAALVGVEAEIDI